MYLYTEILRQQNSNIHGNMSSCFTVCYGEDSSIDECWGPMNGLPLSMATKFLDHDCQKKMILQRRVKPSLTSGPIQTPSAQQDRVTEKMVSPCNPVLPEFFLSKTQCETYLWDILLSYSFHRVSSAPQQKLSP